MELKKELNLIHLVSIASGAMISSGLFVLPGLMFAKAGPGIILAYALASLLVIPALLSKAELSTAMPKAGGVYFFIDRSMGPRFGTIAGFASWFALALKSAFALLGMGVMFVLLEPSIPVTHIKVAAIACCLFFTAVNIEGIKLTGGLQTTMVTVLILLLFTYLGLGARAVEMDRFTPFMPHGLGSVLATAGVIFISFGGLTKVASVSEEVKDPGRDLPLGMFISWALVSFLYVAVLFVTVGLVDGQELAGSLTPISQGADALVGFSGSAVMAIAAILAFITTANAGILAASRTAMAMGRDELIPRCFEWVSARGTPWVAILATAGFMVAVILFLDIPTLVKTASTLALMLFMLVNLSVILMRESNVQYYRPKFRSPGYPWVQIIGIVCYGLLIGFMGLTQLVLVAGFVTVSLLWYLLYARGTIDRQYALLHMVERIVGIRTTTYLLDEELREILMVRDDVSDARFNRLMENAVVLDLPRSHTPSSFSRSVARALAPRVDMRVNDLYQLLMEHKERDIRQIKPGSAVLSVPIKGHSGFEIVMIRCKEGISLGKGSPPVYALFIIASSHDEHTFYLHSVTWITEVVEETIFDGEWLLAREPEELRDVVLLLKGMEEVTL
ncbi:MAG: APC family permease [Candidatus Undinarchaeales archaeon]|jgi:amino acid transporter|nr:APC family permease [Candidatus Undinarchaeales archaeon]MDP7493766.1 APC family permease [Candidatus Undinarchaeales archaeon]